MAKHLEDESSSNLNDNSKSSHFTNSFGSSTFSLRENEIDQINFINYTQKYCVGFIDIINSTNIIFNISEPNKLRKFYSLFLNSMNSIINAYHGKVVKNSGDNLFFYFPKTFDENNKKAFRDVFSCSSKLIDADLILNQDLLKVDLPPISYRISMDYGEVEVAVSPYINSIDLFGQVINNCAKINRLSTSTTLVIGENLHKIANESIDFNEFGFKKIDIKQSTFGNIHCLVYTADRDGLDKGTGRINNQDKQNIFDKESATQISDNSKFNILLIDDDEDIVYTFKSFLKKEGYSVKAFSKPHEALKHFIEINPYIYDLVVMDIRMPDINGIRLYYRFKAIDPYISILLVTALDIVRELVDSLPGIKLEHIVKKPLSGQEFVSKIKSMLMTR